MKHPRQLFMAIFLVFCLSACSASYTPAIPFDPVTFSIDSNGNISITGALNIVTVIGTFALNTAYTPQPQDNTFVLVIRHVQNGEVVDDAYSLNTGQEQVTVVTDGHTVIQVTSNWVRIDATQGNINSITVSDGSATPTTTDVGAATPQGQSNLDSDTAASLIIDYYDTSSQFAGQYLMHDIQALMLTQQDNSDIKACVQYNYSNFFAPDSPSGSDTRPFSLQLQSDGSTWQVTGMGDTQSCTIDSSQSVTSFTPSSPDGPDQQHAADLVSTYYDNQSMYANQYVIYQINQMNFGQVTGNYVGACVSYDYAQASDPNTDAGSDSYVFVFKYVDSDWQVAGMGSEGC